MNHAQLRQHDGRNHVPPDIGGLEDTTIQPDHTITTGPVNVLIMNLPFRVRWQDLKDLCRQACPIERADVALEFDGRSRGFGEVTCFSASDAEKLFKLFDGYEWQSRRLSVIVMPTPRPQEGAATASSVLSTDTASVAVGLERTGHRSQLEFRAPSSIMQPPVATDDKLLFIGNLPFAMQWQDLKDFLRPAGRVQRTDVSIGNDGRSRGWGTALFYTSEEAQMAVEMFNETELEGRKIRVRLDRLGVRGVPVQPMHKMHQQVSLRGLPISRSTAGVYPLQQQQHPIGHPPSREHAPMALEPQQTYSFARSFAHEDEWSFRHGSGRRDFASASHATSYPDGRPYWSPR